MIDRFCDISFLIGKIFFAIAFFVALIFNMQQLEFFLFVVSFIVLLINVSQEM